MQVDLLATPIEYLKGVGPKKADVFKKNLIYSPTTTYFTIILTDILIKVRFTKSVNCRVKVHFCNLKVGLPAMRLRARTARKG